MPFRHSAKTWNGGEAPLVEVNALCEFSR
jgi:hypothetical protein